MRMQFVKVLIPLALPQAYSYRVPADMELKAGDFVRVPLAARQHIGVVWQLETDVPDLEATKIKHIIARAEMPALSDAMRDFVDWMADYVMAAPGLVLRQVMSVPQAFNPPAPIMGYCLTPHASSHPPPRLTPARARVIQVLEEARLLSRKDLMSAANVSAGVIAGLVACGTVQKKELPLASSIRAPIPAPKQNAQGVALSPMQATIATALRASVAARAFGVHLLDGVTGSGKTEVYFEAVGEALKQRQQRQQGQQRQCVLILLPEISLTAQFLERFAQRFGAPPVQWHSGLGAAERRRIWTAVAHNQVPVLVGARSALFLPWHDLGLIIVDEEHDAGFKQEEGVIYNARDMAVVRARFADCPIILSSATPSLETYVNAEQARYTVHHLPHRHGAARLPRIEIIDMRQAPPERGQWIAPALKKAVAQAVADGEQALLFLNRRGYAPLMICRACGHRYACPTCDAWMVLHKSTRKLQCHHCGGERPLPQFCEKCQQADKLVACGPGVERVYEEIQQSFPDARAMILSSDHSGGAARLRQQIKAITDGDVDIIVGTQIVAKGHHFPHLRFVGVIDADLGLGNGDLRAGERTYQLLSQVAGRAGRETTRGFAMLQSYMPDHPVLDALAHGTRDAFFARELAARRAAQMPPYGRLAALIISAPAHDAARQFCAKLARHIPPHAHIRVLGPAPAPIARLRGQYRFRFLIKASRTAQLQAYIRQWLASTYGGQHAGQSGQVRVRIDIDPYHFL